MADVKEAIKNIISEVKVLAVGEFKDLGPSIASDTAAFLKQTEEKLNEWSEKLLSGELKENEFKRLVKNQKVLLEMKALTNAGKTAVAVDNLRQGILNIVTKVILAAIKL
jgi:hypothetical protein